MADYLESAQGAYDKGTDDALRKVLIRKDAKAQKEAKARIEEELGKTMKRKTPKEKEAFAKAVQAKLDQENVEAYKPKIAEHRKDQARSVLDGFKKKIANQRIIRLEDSTGAETHNFEDEGEEPPPPDVVDDDKSPMKVSLQFTLKAPPAPPPPPAAADAAKTPPPPPAPKTLTLTKEDILVTFATAAGTNIHRSQSGETGAWRRDREVNDWSEGCQVFRSPHDFRDFMRMAMLSKRAHCPSRSAQCAAPLSEDDVKKSIGANMAAYIESCPKAFAQSAIDAIAAAFKSPPPPPPPPPPKPVATDPKGTVAPDPKIRPEIEKHLDESKAYKDFDDELKAAFHKVFPTKGYDKSQTNAELMKNYTREKVLAAINKESSEDELKVAIAASIEDYRKKLSETKEAWLEQQTSDQITEKYKEYLEAGMEPCDFGSCGFRFDYMLAEISRADLEAFVDELGDRSWNTLFPEDAPPPPPKPPKPAKPTKHPKTPPAHKPAVASHKPHSK